MSHLNHTSVDDMASSLRLMNPETKAEIEKAIKMFNETLSDEIAGRNRTAALNLIIGKINKLKKKLIRLQK